jgi:hypothetical protein
MTDVLDQPETSQAPRRRRRWPWAVLALFVALMVFVLVWFQPQKLFIDERVDEPIPTLGPQATAPPTSAAPPTTVTAATASTGPAPATTVPPPTTVAPPSTVPAGPVEVARGEFVSRDHGTSGVARVLELGPGQRIVRLEGLDTDNGPDLYLYLTTNPAAGDEGAFDDEFVNLGRLKGNQGDQNYELPAGTDLGRLATVVIWCDRFNSAFGAADLRVAAAA